MAVIHKSNNAPIDLVKGTCIVPARLIPSIRVCASAEKKARLNILFRMHGGVGDIVCAEPSVRYALKHFKDVEFSLATLYPGLFQHLTFKKVFTQDNIKELNTDDYLMYENTDTGNELAAEFICHTLMHAIDYASLYMWRCILPNADKEIMLVPSEAEKQLAVDLINPDTDVVVHPGRTWDSRTFPKNWWDKVTATIIKADKRPVIIGGLVDVVNGKARASTVDVDTVGCLDLRGQHTFIQTTAILQRARVLITNDSSPLHIATSGDAWIGFVSTVKFPDHLLTLRKGVFGWRMQDFARGGVYQEIDICPNKDKSIRVDNVEIRDLLRWLPEPSEIAEWAVSKLKD